MFYFVLQLTSLKNVITWLKFIQSTLSIFPDVKPFSQTETGMLSPSGSQRRVPSLEKRVSLVCKLLKCYIL